MRPIPSAWVLCLAVAAAAAQAGTVSVSFANEGRFADAGRPASEQEANLRTLAHHLQALGQRHLPAEQTLRVEVTDVDLAGELRPSVRRGGELRVLTGGADWPRVSLRYTLESGGRVLSSGEETLSALDYAHRLRTASRDPLHHEKRLLDDWFRERFTASR